MRKSGPPGRAETFEDPTSPRLRWAGEDEDEEGGSDHSARYTGGDGGGSTTGKAQRPYQLYG